VEASDADVIAFYPYLYYPTIRGLPLVRERAILHPAAHEEPALHLPSSTPCSPSAAASPSTPAANGAWWSTASAWPPRRRWWSASGSKRRAGTARRPGPAFGLGDAPYLLCIGRVDDKKGTGILWRYFRAYKERHPGDLRLVLVGQIVDPPDDGRDIVVTGMIDDESKWGLLRGAHALVAPRRSSPSPSR
jgi:glycosyltransferase involved in cell wall biosynthesis